MIIERFELPKWKEFNRIPLDSDAETYEATLALENPYGAIWKACKSLGMQKCRHRCLNRFICAHSCCKVGLELCDSTVNQKTVESFTDSMDQDMWMALDLTVNAATEKEESSQEVWKENTMILGRLLFG
jgi:hypothetical protein